MTAMYWLAVALGGAVGAMGRAGIAALLTTGAGFPWQTFVANVIGSVAIGLIWAALERADAPPLWGAFLITGVLGGFTTFSAFSRETLNLFSSGNLVLASIYIFLTIFLCLAGTWLGMSISK